MDEAQHAKQWLEALKNRKVPLSDRIFIETHDRRRADGAITLAYDGENDELPKSGTWHYAAESREGDDIEFTCPICGTLHPMMAHNVRRDGSTSQPVRCSCGFDERVFLEGWAR